MSGLTRTGPAEALRGLAAELRDGDPLVAGCVSDPDATPTLAPLAAAGPRSRGRAGEYALIVEAVREGYLLHYGDPRIVVGADPDLALLAGDYLYALGIGRLAALGDLLAVRELADLISISAQLQGEGRAESAEALWLGAVVAIGCGPSPAHEEAKLALREGEPEAGGAMREAARRAGAEHGLEEPLGRAFDAVGFGARRG